jgi:cytochrome P450
MMANLEASISVFSYLGLYSWFKPLFVFVSQLFGDLSTQYMQRFIDDRMTEAKSNRYQDEVAPGTPVTMVRKLLNIQTSGAQDLNEGQVGLAAGANVAAGSDTTQIGLSSILFFLYTSPKCLRKLREELVRHEIRDRPSFRETQNLPYLQAVIKESMRLSPGVGLPLWREVPRGGLVVGGQFIPEKVWVISALLRIWF